MSDAVFASAGIGLALMTKTISFLYLTPFIAMFAVNHSAAANDIPGEGNSRGCLVHCRIEYALLDPQLQSLRKSPGVRQRGLRWFFSLSERGDRSARHRGERRAKHWPAFRDGQSRVEQEDRSSAGRVDSCSRRRSKRPALDLEKYEVRDFAARDRSGRARESVASDVDRGGARHAALRAEDQSQGCAALHGVRRGRSAALLHFPADGSRGACGSICRFLY